MKTRYKVILLLVIFFLGLQILTVNTKGADPTDVNYTFQNHTLYNTTDPVYDEHFNIVNQTYYSEDYPGTYSFENDIIGNFPGGDWINNSDDDSTATIINLNSHNKVLKLYDGSSVIHEGANVRNTFSHSVVNGVIEFWFLTNDSTRKFDIVGSSATIHLFTSSGYLIAYDGAQEIVCTITNDVWYHIKLDFNSDTDTYDIYVNGILELNDYDFESATSSLSYIDFRNNFYSGSVIDWYGCIDAIGYSWDANYTVNENRVPSIIETEIGEVDKWEFALQSPDVLNPIGLDDPNGWTDWETSDTVNIQYGATNDREIYMFSNTENFGITKSDFDGQPYTQDDDNINITIKFRYTILSEVKTNLYIRSSDNTIVAQIRWYHRGYPDYIYRLEYYNGTDYIVLDGNIDDTIGLSFIDYNIGINYNFETVNLRFSNATDDFDYSFSTITSGKLGLKAVEFKNTEGDGDTFPSIACGIRVDNIGVYGNRKSFSTEYAWKSIEIPTSWNIEQHNLFEGDLSGRGSVNYTDGVYTVGTTTLEDLLEDGYYTGFDIRNIYDYYIAPIVDPYLILYQVNYVYEYTFWFDVRNFELNSISLDGVQIAWNNGVNTKFLDYTFDIGSFGYPLDNYFFVNKTSSSTSLEFTLTCTNSYLEYIQASFDVGNTLTTGYSIKADIFVDAGVHPVYTGGALSLSFADATSKGYVFHYEPYYLNEILPQNLEIDKIVFLITDDDDDAASGTTTTGYVTGIDLIYYPGISTTITTISLVTMIIPLMIILVPTIAFFKRYGKNIVIPIIILMSIVCVGTELIPIWLFFIIMLSCVTFLIYSNKDRFSRG